MTVADRPEYGYEIVMAALLLVAVCIALATGLVDFSWPTTD